MAIEFRTSGAVTSEANVTNFQQVLLRVGRIDWLIRRASVKGCPRTTRSIGAILDSELAYSSRAGESLKGADANARNYPQVIGVLPGAPAQLAGLIEGDRITTIQGKSALELMSGDSDMYLPENVFPNLDRIVSSDTYHLEIDRNGTIFSFDVNSVPICAGLTAVKQSLRVDAYSDSRNIAITTGFISRLRSDDEVAFVIGHELAHGVFNDSRRSGLSRLEKEDRADIYGVEMARCAGFNPLKAIDALSTIRSSIREFPLAITHRSYLSRKHAVLGFLRQHSSCSLNFRSQ
jgi:hypothetical protein